MEHPVISALPSRVRLDAVSILALTGAPSGRAVAWASDSGVIAPLGDRTDETGRAFAIFTPTTEGEVAFSVTYGA